MNENLRSRFSRRIGDIPAIILMLVAGYLAGRCAVGDPVVVNPPEPDVLCNTEDEVPMEVYGDSYDFEDGTVICLHVDDIRD